MSWVVSLVIVVSLVDNCLNVHCCLVKYKLWLYSVILPNIFLVFKRYLVVISGFEAVYVLTGHTSEKPPEILSKYLNSNHIFFQIIVKDFFSEFEKVYSI